MVDSEQLIRERAYLLWEQDGQIEGRDHEYWERARFLVEQEERAAPRSKPPAADGVKAKTPLKRLARSETVANQGKGPKAPADQGERRNGAARKRGTSRAVLPKPATRTASPSG